MTLISSEIKNFLALMRLSNLKAIINNKVCITAHVFVLDPVK